MTGETAGALRARILVVDDDPVNIAVIVDLLRDRFALTVAKDGRQALARMAVSPLPELVLLDVMMPDMDGIEVCRRLKADPRTREVPVIFISAMDQPHDEARGFEVGAVDYVTKPISPPVLIARIRTHLALCEARRRLADQNRELERRVAERTHQLAQTQEVTIRALASLAETRDDDTGHHIRRTQSYVRVLALFLRGNPRFAGRLDDEELELIYKTAALHDVGKVGIPDAILLKPGRLTSAEFAVMKTHVTIGYRALLAAEQETERADSRFLQVAREMAYCHHERWDGSGYPQGLAGDQIPLSARLMAVADVYDALISHRCYKSAIPHKEAVEIIRRGRGSHFDPDVVDAFLATRDEFLAIAARYRDPTPQTPRASGGGTEP